MKIHVNFAWMILNVQMAFVTETGMKAQFIKDIAIVQGVSKKMDTLPNKFAHHFLRNFKNFDCHFAIPTYKNQLTFELFCQHF